MIPNLRKDFPILKRKVHGKPLVYLDNAATTQKPLQVIKAMNDYYEKYNANIHRSMHALAEEATLAYEEARRKVAEFINADEREIVFTSNATEAINLVAYSAPSLGVKKVVSTQMEHHSNIVPWHLLKNTGKASVQFVSVNDEGFLSQRDLETKLGGADLFTFAMASNVLGTINPVKELSRRARKEGALTLVDAAQGVPHAPVDVKELGCDMMAFTGHKMLGPTGIGVLWAKRELLDKLEPFLGGGNMISRVSLEDSEWNEAPWKFEAGTPNISGAIGLGAAVDYLKNIGMKKVREHEKKIVKTAMQELETVEGLKIIGPINPDKRVGLVTFTVDGVHAHDVATLLDREGIAVRSGHHCTMPLHKKLGVSATCRASFYVYNTSEEAVFLAQSLKKALKVFSK